MTYILVVVLALLVLNATFSAIRIKWPESYYTLGNSSSADFAFSANPLQYAIFRLGPVFITALFVSVTAGRLDLAQPELLAVLTITLHTILSNGRATLAVWKRPSGTRRGPLLMLQTMVGVSAIATAGVASALNDQLDGVVPSVADLTTGLWTAAFAAVATVGVTRATTAHDDAFDSALLRSYEQIDRQLFHYATTASKTTGTDPQLTWTLMVVENLQRPAWFRFAENKLGRFLPNRTTGLLQVRSENPLTDEESIDQVLGTHLSDTSLPIPEYGYRDSEVMAAIFTRHNPDPNFGDLCVKAYDLLEDRFERDFGELLHDGTMGEDDRHRP